MPKPSLDTLADRIERIHVLSGLPCVEMSELAGLVPSHIGMIIRGDVKEPSSATLVKIAHAFGVSLAWLIEGTGRPPTPHSVLAAIEAASDSPAPARKPRRAHVA